MAPNYPAPKESLAQKTSQQIIGDLIDKREKSRYYQELVQTPKKAGNLLKECLREYKNPLNNFIAYLATSGISQYDDDSPIKSALKIFCSEEINALKAYSFNNIRQVIIKMMDSYSYVDAAMPFYEQMAEYIDAESLDKIRAEIIASPNRVRGKDIRLNFKQQTILNSIMVAFLKALSIKNPDSSYKYTYHDLVK